MEQTIELKCKICGKTYVIPLKRYKQKTKNTNRTERFCSPQCWYAREGLVVTPCIVCGKIVERKPSTIRKNKSNRVFCSKSCATTYNNKHKFTGTRRSKLESYLEERLRSEFPNLILICNGKDAIESELDFYFPQLRLAIELNGFLHYEPIYGQDKLERIQANDQQKSFACHQAGIELCVIDASTVNNITASVKDRYWKIFRDLVTPLLGRANSANVQAL